MWSFFCRPDAAHVPSDAISLSSALCFNVCYFGCTLSKWTAGKGGHTGGPKPIDLWRAEKGLVYSGPLRCGNLTCWTNPSTDHASSFLLYLTPPQFDAPHDSLTHTNTPTHPYTEHPSYIHTPEKHPSLPYEPLSRLLSLQ